MKKAIALLTVFAVLFLSCTKKEESASYRIDMVDGTKVVRNFKRDTDSAIRNVSFLEDLAIGVEEGNEDYMFANPVSIEADKRGNIYVLDSRDCVIKKFGPQGNFINQFGGKGQGPGEFERPNNLMISPQDKIFARDTRLNKIEGFSLDGEYQQTFKIENSYGFFFTDSNDLILEKRTYDEEGINYLSIGRFDSKRNEVISFFSQRQYWPARIMDEEFTYEFPYFIRWAFNSEDQVYVSSGIDYEVNVFEPAGNLLFKFQKDFVPVEVAGEELAKINEILKGLPSRAEEKENPFRSPMVYPAFDSISIDEKDRVWIEHYQPLWSHLANKETLYDVFSDEGIFLFSAQFPGHYYPKLLFKNGFIYALRRDESGYSQAVRLRLE